MSNENQAKELVQEVEQLLQKEPEPIISPEGVEMEEWVFVNDKTNPGPRHLFHLLYESVFRNKLGVMHAYNTKDNKVHTVIVGVEVHPEKGVLTWPIAKLLTEEEQGNYKAPDGNGNWIGGDNNEQQSE